MSSPPYFGLRDYGTEKMKWPAVTYQLFGFDINIPEMECSLGNEDKPEEFIGHIILIYREIYRILRDDGTVWVNMGDSYAGSGKGIGDNFTGRWKQGTHLGSKTITKRNRNVSGEIKNKDLIGIPWMMAFALRADGWYLRQDIIWNKPNPMPESVSDRCTKAHEYIFLLSKSEKYYFDQKAILKPVALSVQNDKRLVNSEYEAGRPERGFPGQNSKGAGLLKRKSGNKERKASSERGCPANTGKNQAASVPWEGELANKKSVWTVTTKPFAEAHFATFPEDLIVDCILAGCPEGGKVLDHFMGAGTSAIVAKKKSREYVGVELNPEYIAIAEKRIYNQIGLFL